MPWPDWIAELERTGYDNDEVRAGAAARRDRAATTASARCCSPRWCRSAEPAGRTTSARSSATARPRGCAAIGGAAGDLLALNLPPDAARLLAAPEISQQAYILWDLIHDRTHSHGDLPFDPFMIRQRAPYWMYSLEELRCDLTAYRAGASSSSARALAFARYVQYAILLDRLLRFPITGARVRNYDGLGGQLLFAYLHRHGFLQLDRQPADDRLGQRRATASRRSASEIEELYRPGSTAPSSSTGRRARPDRGERPARDGLEVGRRRS